MNWSVRSQWPVLGSEDSGRESVRGWEGVGGSHCVFRRRGEGAGCVLPSVSLRLVIEILPLPLHVLGSKDWENVQATGPFIQMRLAPGTEPGRN